MLGWDLEGIGKPLSFHMNLADEVLGMAASRKNIWDKCPTCQEFTELVETKVKASHERVLEADLPGSGKDCMMKGGNYEWRFTFILQTTYSLTIIFSHFHYYFLYSLGDFALVSYVLHTCWNGWAFCWLFSAVSMCVASDPNMPTAFRGSAYLPYSDSCQ